MNIRLNIASFLVILLSLAIVHNAYSLTDKEMEEAEQLLNSVGYDCFNNGSSCRFNNSPYPGFPYCGHNFNTDKSVSFRYCGCWSPTQENLLLWHTREKQHKRYLKREIRKLESLLTDPIFFNSRTPEQQQCAKKYLTEQETIRHFCLLSQ